MVAQSSLSPKIQIGDMDPNNRSKETRKVRASHLSSLRRTRGHSVDFEMPELLDETLTSAQFILKSLMMSFDMSQG